MCARCAWRATGAHTLRVRFRPDRLRLRFGVPVLAWLFGLTGRSGGVNSKARRWQPTDGEEIKSVSQSARSRRLDSSRINNHVADSSTLRRSRKALAASLPGRGKGALAGPAKLACTAAWLRVFLENLEVPVDATT